MTRMRGVWVVADDCFVGSQYSSHRVRFKVVRSTCESLMTETRIRRDFSHKCLQFFDRRGKMIISLI